MANVIINDTNLSNIADAIRSKNKSTETYKPGEMAAAIAALQLSENGSFSIDNCDITLISELSRESTTKFWTSWKDYITDLNDIQILVYFRSNSTHFFIKGLCELQDNKLYSYHAQYTSSSNKNSIEENDVGSYMVFTEANGLEVYSSSNALLTPASKGAIYLITSKEVA